MCHFKSGHLTNGFLKNRILKITRRTRKNWNGGNVGESDLPTTLTNGYD